MALTTTQRTDLIKVYLAAFNRAPDASGLDFWARSITDGTHASVISVADAWFADSTLSEVVAAYPAYLSNEEFVGRIYTNVFGRTADAEGLAFWANSITNGVNTKGSVLVNMFASLSNAGSEADKAVFDNKVAVSEHFAVTVGSNDTTLAASVVANVDGTAASVTAAIASIDSSANAGSTFTLTTGVDSITGTANNDTFNALQSGGTDETMGSADTITGGAGTDTMNITMTEDGAFNTPTVSGVEVLNVRNTATQTAARTLDMDNFSGVTSLVSDREVSTINYSNLATSTAVTVSDAKAAANSTFTYKASGVTGTADSASVTLAGAADGAEIDFAGAVETMNVAVSAASRLDVFGLDAGTTTLNLSGAGNFTVDDTLTTTGLTTLNITSSGNVTLTPTLDAATDVVSASTATGDITITAGNVAANTNPGTVDVADLTITTGSGADTINVAAVDAADEVSVNAGAGNDTVVIGDAIANSTATLAGDVLNGGEGTDILSMTSALANGVAAATNTVSNFEEVTISDALAANFSLANIQGDIRTVNLGAGGTGTITMLAGSNTVNVIAPLAGGALGVTDTGTATTDSVTIVNEDEAADAFGGQAITSTGFETVNFVTTGSGTATAQSVGAVTVTADTGGTATVNFSGTNKIDVDGVVTANVLDFSGLTAQAAGTATADMTGQAFEYVGASGSGLITGSAGDDVLLGDTGESTNINAGAGDDTITGGSAAETINGEAGDDTINGGGGADIIYGGAGDDSITMGGTAETVDAGDGDDTVIAAGNLLFGSATIGGAGTDTLSTNAAVSAANGSTVSGFETLTLASAGTTDLDNFANNTFSTVNLLAGAAQTVQSVRSETIQITGALTGDATITMQDATGSADSATIKMSSAAALDTTNDVLVASVETINLVMNDTNTTAHQNTLDLGADSATTINISGNAGVVFATGGNTDIADVITMDASGVVLGAVTDSGITYAATYNGVGGVTTLTGSNGVDSLTGGSATADTINGGAGVDTLVYTGGADVFTGGAGNDVFDINALGTSSVYLTIADLTAGDTIEIADIDTGTATWNATAVSLGSAATFANYLDAAAAGAGNANSIARWFEFGGNTYIVNDNTAGAAFAATDALIKISGSVDLADSTLAGTVLTIA